MEKGISALLLHDQEYPLSGLTSVLETQPIKISRLRTCKQAAELLERAGTPQIIFTDTHLPDGDWADVLNLAARAPVPVCVIVVARVVDIRFYVEVIERGAFDFIVPPFTAADVSHIIKCAADSAFSQRLMGMRAGAA